MSALLLALAFLAAACAQSGPWPSDTAFFPHYPTRRTSVLNGTWAFGWAANSSVITTGSYADILTPNATSVPSSFDVAPPGIKGPRTTVFYRSTHPCTAGVPALLKFYAVNFFARVFVDGVELGNHSAGPYTPFTFVAPPCRAAGARELALMVNNEFRKDISPTATGGDFYFYGGIVRAIVVTELPRATQYYIERVEPVTTDVGAGLIDVRVAFAGALPASVTLSLAFNGGAASAGVPAALEGGIATLRGIAVPNALPWTLGAGNLFTLTVADAASGDALTTRSGLRILGTSGTPARLTINGAVVKLKGYNRHTMWPAVGAAVTPEQERTDLALVLGVNANYIRGGHYPQSQYWLDLLDEAGVAIWEEALGPGVSTKDILDPFFMQQQVKAVTAMVHTSIAHPSVVLHGFFNEGPSGDATACVGYQTLGDTVRALVTPPAGGPPSRFATWASDKGQSDKCLNFSDVVSFNSYPGWYGSPGNVANAAVLWKGNADWVSSHYPTKPFTVSETGAGGIFEWVNASSPGYGQFWSQKYQTSLVTADVAYLLGDARVSGLSLWLLTDFKVCVLCARGACSAAHSAAHLAL
jgi:beta-glucuronidase